jgi:hypothetical protein
MDTVQDLFDSIMEKMQKHASLEQIEAKSNGTMTLWHSGHVNAYKGIAEVLVNRYKCKATFIDTEKRS